MRCPCRDPAYKGSSRHSQSLLGLCGTFRTSHIWHLSSPKWSSASGPGQCEEERYPDQRSLPSPVWSVQSSVNAASRSHPAVTAPGLVCEKFTADPAPSSPAPSMGRKATFKHVLELQISVRTPGPLVPSLCAQLLARKVPQSSLGLCCI